MVNEYVDFSYGDYMEKKVIPNFASFKPGKALEVPRQEIGASEKAHRVPTNYDGTADKSTAEPYEKNLVRYPPREHHEHSSEREGHRHFRSESRKKDPETCKGISKAFTVDRVGDFRNLKFGTDRYATSSYLRFGTGNVVGLPRNQKIDRVASTDKELVLFDISGKPKISDKRARWRLDREGAKRLKIKPREERDPVIDSDYVHLEAAQAAKTRRGVDASATDCTSSSDDYETSYRSVEGRARFKKEPADQDLKYDSDASSPQRIADSRSLASDESAQSLQAQLSRKIEAEPNNFEAWMNLIRHQYKMLGLGEDSCRTKLTNAERRSNSEIRLSMYEKALENVKDRQGRQDLWLGMIKEATNIWETDRVSSCWKSILQQHPHSLRCWTKYLDFMQTNFTCFGFEEMQNAYLDCLKTTNRARFSDEISVDERDDIFEMQIFVVLRMTLFMRESGFAELATAAWQALLEFVFFKPIFLQNDDRNMDRSSEKIAITMFGEFWDSEVPRIGEEGAEGWATFHQKPGKPLQPRIESAGDLKDSKDHWRSWLASERRHSLLSRNPARSIDDIAENDPYRIVLFSDIRPFLVDPPSHADQQLILDAFLAFCRLPPFAAQGPDSRSRVWGRDGFLRNDTLRLSRNLQNAWKLHCPQHGNLQEQHSDDGQDHLWHLGTHDAFQFPFQHYQVSSDSLFGEKWFSAFHTWEEQRFADGGPVDAAWVLRSLKSLVDVSLNSEAVELHALALELKISPSTVRKSAKQSLKKRPFSIPLYNAYALIEYRLANIKTGESIIFTSINMAKKLDEDSQRDMILLWRTWIWETLSALSAQQTLVRLLAIGNGDTLSEDVLNDMHLANPALLLRTERFFIDIRDRMLSLSSYSQATFAMECLMLFAYLRTRSLSAATADFTSNKALLSFHIASSSSHHEYLHQSIARLVYYHATHTHMFRPVDIRSLLAESIVQFPQNTIFLSLYAWNEARFRIDDRLRSVVRELILAGSGETGIAAQDNVILHFFAIYSELQRAVTCCYNSSTIRSTFERAVESDSGAHCAGLWKLYFLFEHSRSEPERAKEIFWRGLAACPWAKDLYILAFEHLRDNKTISEADLRGIYELMGEKELRVHVGLDQINEETCNK